MPATKFPPEARNDPHNQAIVMLSRQLADSGSQYSKCYNTTFDTVEMLNKFQHD